MASEMDLILKRLALEHHVGSLALFTNLFLTYGKYFQEDYAEYCILICGKVASWKW